VHALTAAAVGVSRYRKRNSADGPIAGENFTLCRRARKQVSTPRQKSSYAKNPVK
jgi:hypothetical protein